MAIRKLARKTTYGLGFRFDPKRGYYVDMDLDGEEYRDYFTKDEVRQISKTARKLREDIKKAKTAEDVTKGRTARPRGKYARSQVKRVALPTKAYRAVVSGGAISKRAVTSGYGHNYGMFIAILPYAPDLDFEVFSDHLTKEAIRKYWAEYNNINSAVVDEILALMGLDINDYQPDDFDEDMIDSDLELDDLF